MSGRLASRQQTLIVLAFTLTMVVLVLFGLGTSKCGAQEVPQPTIPTQAEIAAKIENMTPPRPLQAWRKLEIKFKNSASSSKHLCKNR